MKRSCVLAVVVALFSAIFLNPGNASAAQSFGYGYVYNEVTQAPMANVTLTVLDGGMTCSATDADGFFMCEAQPLEVDSNVRFTKARFVTTTVVIHCSSWIAANPDLTLTPYGRFRGKVKDSAGVAVAGATVSAGGETYTTNSEGAYVLWLPPGTYNVNCTKSGYTGVVRPNRVITAGQITTVNFTLSEL